MWDLSKHSCPTRQVQFSAGFMDAHHIQRTVYSTDCRHTFCEACLFEWWTSSRATTCPSCRTICENVPVRDRSNGLASLISKDSNETLEFFDPDNFADLMTAIQMHGEENQDMEVEVMEAQEAMEMGYTLHLDGAGTSTDPLDLTDLLG
jgi:hypothetical protein